MNEELIKGTHEFAVRAFKNLSSFTIALALCFYSFAQPARNTAYWNKIIKLENDTLLTNRERLLQALSLKRQFENEGLIKDSVYARILHRIGLFEFKENDRIATKDALLFTHIAASINSSGRKGSAPAFCLNSYNNLAIYYRSLKMYHLAARYFDSAITLRRKFPSGISEVLLLKDKAEMLHAIGDFQKAVEEINIAIPKAKANKDTNILQSLLNQRALSYLMEGELEKALSDINLAGDCINESTINTEATNSLITKARVFGKMKYFSNALSLFNKAIQQRLQTFDYSRIANDYTNLGNFYLDDLLDYNKAKECYLATVRYALKGKDQETVTIAHSNLEYCSFKQHNFKDAVYYCMQALNDLKLTPNNKIFINPTSDQLSTVENKELAFAILGNKTELLLNLYKETGNKNYLAACQRTALLTDTLLTSMRHEQLGEQSKLYWRNRTRAFFDRAMDACYLNNNAPLAFYFMEKSRAVLLNDKLNELGASAYLPQAEAVKEWEFQIEIVTEQQKFSLLSSNGSEYDEQLSKLSNAKNDLEHYIKSLEARYPTYYQYKYADEVPSLSTLQNQLAKNKQSFVHYFMNDTVAYVLGITPVGTKLIKLSKDKFNAGQLTRFLNLCSDEIASNTQYSTFTLLSDSIYKLLYQPLNIPKGRVVICPDNFLIPFDALSTDTTGNHLLLNDYVFSYVYSARSLLKQFNTYEAEGNFIGFAPVTFKSYTNVADLKLSDEALQQSAKYYGDSKLYTNNNASRHNFINSISSYTIANIFSHALSDTTVKEPVLYMYDSAIYLSELQLLHQPATQLVVLSACQTAVGKSAKGEGIFSLARGFATAGIPSVAATLWNADEQSLYTITAKFHEYLSQGMPKDEALQKAKLYFIENEGTEKQLPYYWANIILVGDQTPIKLSENHHIWWWVVGVIFITAIAILTVQLLKRYGHKTFV
jgi:CHAT domain-containing protein/tetratricopeptide (TPR) repeat protein